MECGRKVDPVWYHAIMRKQRERKRLEAYSEERARQFNFQPISYIEKILRDDGGLSSDSDEGRTGAKKSRTENSHGFEAEETLDEVVDPAVHKKKRVITESVGEDDPLPEKYRLVKKNERKVRDETLIAIGNLVGE